MEKPAGVSEELKVAEAGTNGAETSGKLQPSALQRLEALKDQIESHYVASLIYKDLEKHLSDRDQLVAEFENKLAEQREQLKEISQHQQDMRAQIEALAARQHESLEEYQAGARELEEQLSDIDRQIAELEQRKHAVLSEQAERLRAQDETQSQMQGEIEQLEVKITELEELQRAVETQIEALNSPEELAAVDTRITDLIHHICSIFEPAAAAVAINDKADGSAVPPIFQLDPWNTEEDKKLTKVAIPVGAKQVVMSFHMPNEAEFDRYSAELYSSNGRRVWNNDKLEANGRSVVVTFNSTFFLSDDYELRLKGRGPERSLVPVAEYYFHVSKGKS